MRPIQAWFLAGPKKVKRANTDVGYGQRRLDVSVHPKLLDTWMGAEDIPAADALAQHVIGVFSCRPDFIYDCGCILTETQRAQRLHWKHWGVQDKDLWFLQVQDVAILNEPLPCMQFLQHSKASVFDILSEDVVAELELYLQDIPNGRPDWLEGSPRLCLKVPPRVAHLLLHHRWRSVCFPSPFVRGRFQVAEWKLDMLGHGFARAFEGLQAPQRVPQDAETGMFSLEDCQNLADDIRSVLCQLPEDKQEELLPWLQQLQNSSDSISGQHMLSEKFVRMLDFVMLCELLHDVSQAREVIQRSVKLCLPAALHHVADMFLKENRLFDKGQVSRFRVTFDVAFMLFQQAASWTTRFLQGQKTARYLMWDSSPQYRRDYEMIRVVSIPELQLINLFQAFDEMALMWLEGDDVEGALVEGSLHDNEASQREESLMRDMQCAMRPHVLPAVLLGFGATSLAHKFHALAHAFRLEQFNARALDSYCREFVSVTSDFGVEHMLGQVDQTDISSVCQFFDDPDNDFIQRVLRLASTLQPGAAQAIFEDPAAASHIVDLQVIAGPPSDMNEFDSDGHNGLNAVDLELGEDLLDSPQNDPIALDGEGEGPNEGVPREIFEEAPPVPCMDFTNMLSFPGVHHVLDNAVNGMSGVMRNYDELIAQAAKLCKFLKNSETRDILLERCFACPVGVQFRQAIREFTGNIYPGRWGTVAFSIPQLQELEHALRWGWDKDRYLLDANARRGAVVSIVEDVDKAIGSAFFWAWLRVVNMLVKVVRRTTAWIEGCSCHWPLFRRAKRDNILIPPKVRRRWLKCPMRGLRAFELCNGEFLEVAGILCENSAVQLLHELPADITAEDRASLVSEFDAARAHLCFYLSMKLHAMQEWPWKICALAHPDRDVAHDVLREALATPFVDARLALLQGPLRPLCARWLAGESLLSDGMSKLLVLVAELRFIPINERPAEALHRQTKLHGRSRPCHSVGLMSLKQRMPEIKSLLQDQPCVLQDLAQLCHEVRNNWLSVCSLGLQGHPSLHGLRRGRNSFRHPMMAQVIYHADPQTLYSIPVPEIAMRPGAPPPPPPGGDDDDDDDEADDDARDGQASEGDGGDGGDIHAADSGDDDADDGPGDEAGSDPDDSDFPDQRGLRHMLQRQTSESKLLLHALMIQRLCAALKDDAHFLSLPYPATAMRTLASALQMPNQPGYQGGSDINLDAELRIRPEAGTELPIEATLAHKKKLSVAARALMFFKVVRSNPGSLKRNKVQNEVGFSAADMVVAPHRLCQIQFAKKQMAVEATALQMPARPRESIPGSSVIISFSVLECEQLAQLRVWDSSTRLECFIKADLLPESGKWSADMKEAAAVLLSELVETPAGVHERFWRLAAERKKLLQVLHGHGWVEKHEATLQELLHCLCDVAVLGFACVVQFSCCMLRPLGCGG